VAGIPLVGRGPHLQALDEAFAALKRRQTVAVRVHGRSGVGKSALVGCFLDRLREGGEAVVLAGRCYEQESMPYKALDSLVDALGRHLGRLSDLEVQALLPRDVSPLVRIFPVLRGVRAVAAAWHAVAIPDPHELRHRAFAGLRELLARLGDRVPLILAIDDLQWGDVDSAALLGDLLLPPDPPVLLLVAAYRSEDAATSPFLRALAGFVAGGGWKFDRREVTVDPLPLAQAEELARLLLGEGDPALLAHAGAVAREAGGNPYFVHELVRHLQAGRPQSGMPAESLTLEKVIGDRVRSLPEEERRLLEVVSVAGRPLRRAQACQAAELGGEPGRALAALRAAHLIRSTGAAEEDDVETYHDRIRESVVAQLPPAARREHHRRLARTLERAEHSEPEVLAVHFLGADELAPAGQYYARAAEQAAQALAFDRAAKLYRQALDLLPIGQEQGRLRTKLGEALGNAGRGAEAAREYLAAAADDPAAVIELRRLAATHLLMSGHVDEGVELLQDVLKALGTKLPATPRRALWSLLWHRVQLRLRGLGYREREAGQVDPRDLARIDVFFSIVMGLVLVDPIRGLAFQTRCLLLALRAGEPYRVARSLSIEAGHISIGGSLNHRRAAVLQEAAEAAAERAGHPHSSGAVLASKGVVAYLEGRYQTGHEFLDRAEEVFRTHCTGVTWELDSVRTFSLWCLTYMGEVAELSRRWPALLKDAQERGDLYAVTNLSTYIMAIIRLAADDPETARQQLKEVTERWSRSGFHLQHHNILLGQILIELYTGNGRAAWDHVGARWPAYGASLLRRVQHVRVDVRHLRARSALAVAATAADPRLLLRVAEGDAAGLRRERAAWADGLAWLIRAQVAAGRGNLPRAVALLEEAVDRLDRADLRIYAAAARRRLGRLIGGDRGRELVAAADAWMTGQQVRNPARMTAMFTPGFRD
jgi:tetratricopeptide (TPR) repeat protein